MAESSNPRTQFWRCAVAIVAFILISTASSCVLAEELEDVLGDLPNKYQKAAESALEGVKSFRKIEAQEKDKLREFLKSARESSQFAPPEFLSQVKELEKWLEVGGEIPKSDKLLEIVFNYVNKLSVARAKKVSRKINNLIVQLKKDELPETADRLFDAFSELGGLLNPHKVIQQGRSFGGTRMAEGSTDLIRIRIHIEQVADEQFSGIIERDMGYADHPSHDMQGRLDGVAVVINTLARRKPGAKLDGGWQYSGVIVGKSIVGTFSGHTIKGKPGKGYFRLDMN